jgi:predicted lactoylglutathione lyase
MFDHVQIKVNDLNKSCGFYGPVLKTLGYEIVLEIEGVVVGYGNNPHDMFEIMQTSEESPLSQSTHIAFIAKNENAVKNFYETALKHGGKTNGEPKLRPEYEEGYYSAFVIDPNGHNLEAVYKKIV